MSLCSTTIRCSCTLKALIASLVVGIIGAFLQVTAAFTITQVFLGSLSGSPLASRDCCSFPATGKAAGSSAKPAAKDKEKLPLSREPT